MRRRLWPIVLCVSCAIHNGDLAGTGALQAACLEDGHVKLRPHFIAYILDSHRAGLFRPESPTRLEAVLAGNSRVDAVLNGGFFDFEDATNGDRGGTVPTGLIISDGLTLWSPLRDVADGTDSRRLAHTEKARRELSWGATFWITPEDVSGVTVSRDSLPATLRMAIEAGPALLLSGTISTDEIARAGKFGASRQVRSAVATTEPGCVILYASTRPRTLAEVAADLLQLGATDALSLDGGPSTGLLIRQNPRATPTPSWAVDNYLVAMTGAP